MVIKTKSEKETIEVGKKFARRLKGGEVVLLIGDLGSGKTTFVRGVARGFGYQRNVTSPTFVIMKVYELRKATAKDKPSTNYELATQPYALRSFGGQANLRINKVVHVDTYRGLDIGDLENIGAMEYFGREDCVSFVEWGAGLETWLKKNKYKYFVVKIRAIDENKREIEIR